MKQSYFITVRTQGPCNANSSTRELCSIIKRKLDATLISSKDDYKKVLDYVKDIVTAISDKNKRCKPLKVVYVWESSTDEECARSLHFTVGIDGTSSGENTFLQVNFTPVRHTYMSDCIIEELYGAKLIPFHHYPKPTYKKVDLDKLAEGDIIVCEDLDFILIVKSYSNQKLTAYCYFDEPRTIFDKPRTISSTTVIGYTHRKIFHYATDEERDILFNEMHVAGLRWNPTEGKIEQIP